MLLLKCFPGSGQSSVSGVVNTYHQVVEIIPAKACLRITNIAALDVNSRVMVVQMKGASINTTNSSSFGDITALNEAGNYEIGTVCYIKGDSVFLFHQLLNAYNTTTGKVQLVQFAEYVSATVVDTVKAIPWDNGSGTGGVIAIFADQDITLNAPIYAGLSGYSGGAFLLSGASCSDVFPANGYYYTASVSSPSQSGAYKGEGIADLASTQTGGRGAAANGGGGGNNHNNSGGGGANISNGGIGGGNSSNGVSCTVTRRGEAGKALSNSSGQKIFMGGGGGAGHNNNGVFTKGGGHGGGIVFIWATNISGNNQTVSADGGTGGESASDGAGGGGAGGTIIIHTDTYTGNINVSANGGAGGNSNDGGNIGRCFGGGGGGSGGVIYFNGTAAAGTILYAGGAAGTESGRDASCAAAQPATAGNTGFINTNYNFSRSTITAGYCQLLLPVKLISFFAEWKSNNVFLEWEVANPEMAKRFVIEKSVNGLEWRFSQVITAESGRYNYTATDTEITGSKMFYRLRITR
ncbi:MAG: hypothetical protein IPH18_04565 [Chitinophagaceae bacterium]|nr:hypothetical protein [Chitinophagaceae bacterium]